MKRVFAFFFCALLAGQVWAQSFEKDGLYYSVTSNTEPYTVQVIHDDSYHNLTIVEIPETVMYNGVDYSVTSINMSAFVSCSKIESISIPKSITSLSLNSFNGCNQVKTLTYNTNAMNTDVLEMFSLRTVNIGDDVTSIGDGLFMSNNLGPIETVNIGNSVTQIGENAFKNLGSLTSIIIGNSVTSIGAGAFLNCRSLTNIEIPESVISIGENAFSGVGYLKYSGTAEGCPWGSKGIRDGDFVFSDVQKTTLIEYIGNGGDVVIPNTVISIGGYAFADCTSLTSIVIPESVMGIGDEAFSGCSGLETVTMLGEEGAYTIYTGNNIFKGCFIKNFTINRKSFNFENGGLFGPVAFDVSHSLETANLGSCFTEIPASAFSGCSNLVSVTFPDNITSIGSNAFIGCSKLEYVNIPNSVTSIGNSAFAGSGLTSITIPESVTYIDNTAFLGCSGLKTITYNSNAVTNQFANLSSIETIVIGNTVTAIRNRAFYACTGLTSVTIPESVTSIGGGAFAGCTGLTSFTIPGSITSIGEGMLAGCTGLTSITIPNGVTEIGSYAFQNCTGLTSVTIPESVTSIGENAFDGCTNLTSLTIPESVTSIGEDACKGLEYIIYSGPATEYNPWGAYSIAYGDFVYQNLEKKTLFGYIGNDGDVVIPNTVSFIWLFKDYSSKVTGIEIPNSVTKINQDAFDDCTGIKTLTYNTNAIDNNILRRMTNLVTVNVGDDITSIGSNLFSRLTNIKTINIGSSVSDIGERAFNGCSGLTSVTIPNSVTSIGDDAFNDCYNIKTLTYNTDAINRNNIEGMRNLETVNIGDAVTNIEEDLFSGLSSIKTVTIGNAVTNIGSKAFNGCSGLTSIEIPNSVTNVGGNAFGGCSGLTSVATTSNADFSNSDLCFIKENIKYSVINKNSVAVASKPYSGDLVIPNTVTAGNTFSVTKIGDYAFFDCDRLTSVTIPEGITYIGTSAFEDCEGLTSITIPESVTSFGRSPFRRCFGIRTLTYNTNAVNSEDFSISNDMPSIETINIGNSVTSIGEGRFSNLRNLKTVNIGSGVTSIGDGAFSSCIGLETITIPEAITYVGDYAFRGCNNLSSVIIETNADVSNAGLAFTKDDVRYSVLLKNTATLNDGSAFSGDLVIPETVTAGNTFTIKGIGERAFADNTNITSITLPEYVTDIGNGAFSGCNNIETLTYNTDAVGAMFSGMLSLKTVNIGDAVTRLDDGAFAGCRNLENVSVGNGIESVGNNVFDGCNFLDYNIYSNGYYLGNSQNPNMILMSARNKSITSCTVSADCRFICDGAFRDCKRLAEVVLPESLTYVNNGLFSGCGSLRSVAIPEAVTAIGDEAFKGCSSLAEIKIPESVTTIGSNAFAGCSGITALTIPNRVTSVSNNAFDGCTNLETVVIGKSVAEFSSDIFANCSGLDRIICYAETPIRLEDDPFIFSDTIYVPATSVDAYKAATIWKRKDIMPFYKVKILSANEALGTAEGDTLILGNHTATLTATPVEGYHFARWSDNNTESPRALAATKDTVLTAFFEAHTTVTDFAVAATCEAFGLTEGSHCPGCGYVFVKQDTLPAQGHKVVVDAAVAATCTTAGKTEGSHCSVCNAVMKAQEVIAAPGHTVVVDLAKPATCTVTGWTDGKHCSVCNTILVAPKEVPAFGHEFGEYVYNNDATTESDGTETALCKHGCGASVSRVALGTKLAESTTQPETVTAVSETAASNVNIYAHHNTIVVENAQDEIRVYDAMGNLICRDAIHRVRMEINVNAPGVYIVKTGSVVKRIVINF